MRGPMTPTACSSWTSAGTTPAFGVMLASGLPASMISAWCRHKLAARKQRPAVSCSTPALLLPLQSQCTLNNPRQLTSSPVCYRAAQQCDVGSSALQLSMHTIGLHGVCLSWARCRTEPGEHPAGGEGLWGTTQEVPSFLYAMRLPNGSVFLEETCLVAKPALPFATLKRRLHRRLNAMGITVSTIRHLKIGRLLRPMQPQHCHSACCWRCCQSANPGKHSAVCHSARAIGLAFAATCLKLVPMHP